MLGMGGGQAEPLRVLIWVGAVFVSILVHEFGHALVARGQGAYPNITLYAFGGLASYQPVRHSPWQRIQVAAAGPAAGFLLAACTMIALRVSGRQAGLVPRGGEPLLMGAGEFYQLSLVAFDAFFTPLASNRLNLLIVDLLVINILWGMINLLPVFPLDGGQIAPGGADRGESVERVRPVAVAVRVDRSGAGGLRHFGELTLDDCLLWISGLSELPID